MYTKQPFGIGKSDAYLLQMSDALYALMAAVEQGCEYHGAEQRIAARHHVQPGELRQAYDEWTSITHNPEDYL